MKDFLFLQQKYIVNTYTNRQVSFLLGDGMYLYNEQKVAYLDLMTNYGVTIFGYNHPEITKGLTRQLKRIVTLHGSFGNDMRAEASEVLVKRCGGFYNQVYWSSSGAEAIEAALKFAVLTTKKRKFLVAENGYHGKTLGALSATAGEKYKDPFSPLLWEFIPVPFNDARALELAIDDQVAGFIVEPIQGEGGIFVPSDDYLQSAGDICRAKGVLFIIDEIQTGAGRTGSFLRSEGIAADIVCLGKGLAGGIPVGATVVNKRVSVSIPKHIHTSTFGGNPLTCAGVLITLKLLDESRLHHIQEIGDYFLLRLGELDSAVVTQVRGIGLMIGLEVQSEKRNKILKLLQDELILAIPAGENVVRFLPPFIIEREQVDMTIEKLEKVLKLI